MRILTAILFALVAIFPLGSRAEDSKAANALKMIEEIKKDSGVVDVFYDPKADIQWNIGVQDDGRDLYALANYYCAMIQGNNADEGNISVRIVDIIKIRQGRDFSEADLGTDICEVREDYAP